MLNKENFVRKVFEKERYKQNYKLKKVYLSERGHLWILLSISSINQGQNYFTINHTWKKPMSPPARWSIWWCVAAPNVSPCIYITLCKIKNIPNKAQYYKLERSVFNIIPILFSLETLQWSIFYDRGGLFPFFIWGKEYKRSKSGEKGEEGKQETRDKRDKVEMWKNRTN